MQSLLGDLFHYSSSYDIKMKHVIHRIIQNYIQNKDVLSIVNGASWMTSISSSGIFVVDLFHF